MKIHHFLLGLIILFFPCQSLLSQTLTIKGKVTDVNNEELIGVTVNIKGTTLGTVTDENGTYSISGISNSNVLVFSYVGFITQEVLIGTQTSINLVLEADVQNLSEVVVVGYGTQKKLIWWELFLN